MSDERSLYDRLDSLEATEQSNNNALMQILNILQSQKSAVQNQPQPQQPKQTKQELFQQFLKGAKKSWRWFGTRSEFSRWKALAIFSSVLLLIIGLLNTIVSSVCFQMYSFLTLFENVWLVFGIIFLVFASKTKQIYEVNELASHSPRKYETDHLGMKFPGKEKVVFRIFRWIAIISVICNIVFIWVGMGKNNQILATITELLFLATIIFSFFMNLNLFAQYSIIWVEGYNTNTKEKVVLVLPPGAKQLMPEEEFRKKMPFFYE